MRGVWVLQSVVNLELFFGWAMQAITSKDGQALAHNILAFSEDQTCPDPAGFTSELKSLFDGLDLDKIKVGRQSSCEGLCASHMLLSLILTGRVASWFHRSTLCDSLCVKQVRAAHVLAGQ